MNVVYIYNTSLCQLFKFCVIQESDNQNIINITCIDFWFYNKNIVIIGIATTNAEIYIFSHDLLAKNDISDHIINNEYIQCLKCKNKCFTLQFSPNGHFLFIAMDDENGEKREESVKVKQKDWKNVVEDLRLCVHNVFS